METLEIGSGPAEESCAQIGTLKDDFSRLNKLECRAYRKALTKVFGEPPAGASFTIKSSQHEFGTYHEVVLRFDVENADHMAYADKVENGLGKWSEAKMWPPVTYDDRSRPVRVIDQLELLDQVNPEAKANGSDTA